MLSVRESRTRPTRRVSARSPGAAVTAAAVRQVRRGTLLVAAVAAGLPALVAAQHPALEGAVGTRALAALAENPAVRTLFGPPVALDDPGGFAVWRTGTALALLVGTWAALTATRVTRGEEEAGRWHLLLAGRVPLPAVVARSVLVLWAASAVVGAAVAGGLAAGGAAGTGAVLFGAGTAGTGMVGAALGALAAQLRPDRRSASGAAVGMLLAGLLARMVGDGVPAWAFLHWATPFGLLGRSAPFAGDRLLPLAVLAALAALPAVLAVRSATGRDLGGARGRRRDLGSARWPRRERRTGSRVPPRSLTALAVHRTARPVLSWAAGLAAYYLLVGLLAAAMVAFLRDNPVLAGMAAAAGFPHLGSVPGYAASLFSLLAVPVGAFAAARIAATGADESAGRLTLLLAQPVPRTRWLAREAAVVAAACPVLAGVAGLATWAGSARVDAGLGPAAALAGTLAVVPVALLCLGAALLALGWLPSAVLPVGVLPAAGGYLLLVLADTSDWPRWVRGLSPFAHLAAVPAEPVDVPRALALLLVAGLLAAGGLAGYARRDLRN